MDESPLQLVSKIGSKLAKLTLTRFNKSLFLDSLKQAESALLKIEQPQSLEASNKVEALKKLEAATKPLRKSIIKHGLLHQNDKDVRLSVATCISELFWILAPEPPFEDKDLRGVFELFVGLFKELGNTGCPFFSKRVKILEIVARCKCFVIMLDMDCNDLVLQMFDNFFSVVRLCSEPHLSSLINHILSIMTHILNEEASQPLLEAVLRNLVKQQKDASSAASQLAVSVIQSCAEKLESFVCGFLTSCFLDRDTVESDLKEFYHEIIFKIFQCSPQMLLAIIPVLIQELQIDQVDVRIKAVNLIGKLSALPENHLANRYPELFAEFLKRFSDKSAEVRLSALQCAKACYLANPFRSQSLQILTAIESRLLDFDDRVRTEAVVVACDLARSHLKFVPAKLISEAAERLRDKKISVRKKALQKLLEVYRDYCKKCSESEMTICDHFEQIPCKILLLCYDKDCKEFRSQNIEQILAEDLFPVLEIEESTRHWVHLFSLFTSLHVKALHCILSQKQRLRTEMRLYLSLRKKEKENSPEDTQKRMKISFMKMSASFPDPSKAEEFFRRLNEMKDKKIFNALEELLDDLTIKNAKIARDKFLRLIGDKHPEFDFLQLLSSKCLYIVDSEHVRCIVDGLSSNKFEDKNLEVASIELLLAIISVFPSLLRGSELQFEKLLEGNLINDKLIEVLAKAGPHISVKFSDIYPLLERLCLEGTRAQSKSAVSAIASLSGASQQFVFAELCKGLVDSLHSGRYVPTVLQSLGCIAQYSVSSFESQNEDITPYINKNIIQVESLNVFASCDENSGCDTICKLRIYGLKTLVKSFLPHRGSHVNRKISDLLDVLSEMLQKADAFNGHILCENNDAHVRLAAAKAVLRLSRRWDLHISPRIFCSTILMSKVSSAFVRRTFLDKTHKLLKAHAIPSRYACAFALTASDCQKDLRDDSFKYMAEFIKDCSREARIRQNSAVQGVSITDYPAYIVVFLIHILAHDIGFPSEDCQDDRIIAQFFCPLFSFLQALVNASIVDGDMDLVNDAVLYLLSIFRAIKRAEDAVDAHRTPKLHILADIGVSIVKELNHNEISSRAPGLILLPSSLYQFSPAKKSREVRFEQSFVERVVQIFKSHISVPATTVRKRGQKRQEESKHSDVKNTTLKLVACKQLDLPCGTIDSGNKNVGLETNIGCKEKQAYSSSAPLAKPTMELSLTQSQVSSQKMERTASLKENIAPVAGIIAESSGYSRVKDLCSAKISNHSGEVELLCLDSKSEEINGGNSLSQREVLLEEDSNTLHLRHGNRHRTVDTFSGYSPQQLKALSEQKRRKFCGRTVLLAGAAKGKRGRQVLEETSASEVINVNDDAVTRRTRSRKV
ncbi:sister chromatid cohesion protein PDS5-like A isoform X1 [Melia azedarach]|uniref:Sister chromatid cohesion protein PDS5-like A isoform X1 n=2 Tax=Melia azedarach TaxID=155640 RepID=A0ACC1WNG2_MELAZ|nr:sister chromatid cohesion protein PDS5-like A isoform X1 [Melia azedarach]KAJ4700671.1 sister chromatid cohesion protein PDS5-like A isoform X1 [Melia azedarach]